VVNGLRDKKEIIFVPDKYLADFVSRKTGRELIVWDGFCPVHAEILPRDIKREKGLHPGACVIVHPECLPEVIALASAALSTSQMCSFVKTSQRREFIIGTEVGLIYRLKKENPRKEFYPGKNEAVCWDMKQVTIKDVLEALEGLRFEVRVPGEIRRRARRAIKEMVKIA
jgi:quinolinate synthase